MKHTNAPDELATVQERLGTMLGAFEVVRELGRAGISPQFAATVNGIPTGAWTIGANGYNQSVILLETGQLAFSDVKYVELTGGFGIRQEVELQVLGLHSDHDLHQVDEQALRIGMLALPTELQSARGPMTDRGIFVG